MAGDITNAALWADADVWVGTLDAANPATIDDDFDEDWGLVGLLDGDAGFTYNRSVDKSDFFAWGQILVRTARKNFKLVRGFTVLEDNEVTRELIWPGSSETEIVVPIVQPVKLAFQLTEGDVVKRVITRNYAEVDVDGDIKESESDLTKYPLVATIYPDATVSPAVLFDVQSTESSGS